MLEQVLSLFSGNYALSTALTTALIGIVAVLLKAVSMFNQAIDTHDKHFVEKRQRRLLELRGTTESGSALDDYLKESAELESFRIASGIRASARRANALMALSKLGFWDDIQIRRMSQHLYVTPENPTPRIELVAWDWLVAYYSFFAAVAFLVMGIVLLVLLTAQFPVYGFFTGLALFGLIAYLASLLAGDYISYRIALRVKNYLKEHPDALEQTNKSQTSQKPIDTPKNQTLEASSTIDSKPTNKETPMEVTK